MLSLGSHSMLIEHPLMDIWNQGKPHDEFSKAFETVTHGILLEKVAAGALLADWMAMPRCWQWMLFIQLAAGQ